MFDLVNFLDKCKDEFRNINIDSGNDKICVACSGDTKSLGLLYILYNYLFTNKDFNINNLYCLTVLFEDNDSKNRDIFMKKTCRYLGIKYISIQSDMKYADSENKKWLTYKYMVNKCKEENIKFLLFGNTIDNRIKYFFENLNNLNGNLDSTITDYKFIRSGLIKMIRPFVDIVYKSEINNYLKELQIKSFNHLENEDSLDLTKVTRNSISNLLSIVEEYNVCINKISKEYTDRNLIIEEDKFILELKSYIMNYNYRIYIKYIIYRILKYKNKLYDDINISDIEYISKHISIHNTADKRFKVKGITIDFTKFNKDKYSCSLIFYKERNE